MEIGRVPLGAKIVCSACGFEFTTSCAAQSHNGVEEGRGEEQAQRPREVISQPSLRMFFSGTFTFPFQVRTLAEWMALVMAAIPAAGAVWLAIWCATADNDAVDKFTRVLLWNGLLLSTTFGAIAIPAWIGVASAYGLTILRETSHGCDAIESWPNVLMLEGLGGAVCMVNAIILCLLPGLLAAPLWHWLGTARPLMTAVGVPVLFPLFLLSMLETNSPTSPLSLPVWSSLWWAWRAWALFYLLTFGVAAMAVALPVAATVYAGRAVGVVVTGVVIAAAWMIYCRLLGRLAWFCSGRSSFSPLK